MYVLAYQRIGYKSLFLYFVYIFFYVAVCFSVVVVVVGGGVFLCEYK